MNERYIVAVNRGTVRIYEQSQPVGQTSLGLKSVLSLDIPGGRSRYQDTLTYQAGRHPSQPQQGGNFRGMSIDERLPGQQEHEKRAIEEVVREVEAFLSVHPNATWDFAAPAGVHQSVLEKIAPQYRNRIGRALTKDLTNMPPAELRTHFTE
jgi:hypothetical protein